MISTKKPTKEFKIIENIFIFLIAFIIGIFIGIQGVIAVALIYIGYQLYKRNELLEKKTHKKTNKKSFF